MSSTAADAATGAVETAQGATLTQGASSNTAHAFQVWLNVINALLLRDIRARAGRFYTGYVVIFLMPFAHLAIVLAIFVALDKVPPVGTQPTLFFGLSILPFVVFVYPSRQIVIALSANRPLLYFPRVKIKDIIFARGLLECANGLAFAALVFVVLFVSTGEFAPRDPFGMLCAVLLTLYLGCAWGACNGLIAHPFHFWVTASNLCFPLLWMLSGIVINVQAYPAPIPYYFSYNPLFQCIEYLRYSNYEGYPDNLLDVWYVFWVATCMIAASLVFERVFRRSLLSA
jgi:capsular polysaccharide transport system permease protein